MTTTVIIKAHCDPKKKEVKIEVKNDPCTDFDSDIHFIQDGEEKEICVYDEMSVTVKEVEKSIPNKFPLGK